MIIHTIVKLNVKGAERQEQSKFLSAGLRPFGLVHNSLLAILELSAAKLSIKSAACHHNDDFVHKCYSRTAECIRDRNTWVFSLYFYCNFS